MLLKDNDGIRCDRCGLILRKQFRYFSYDLKAMAVRNNILPPFTYDGKICFSLDVCEGCHQTICDLVVKMYRPTLALPGRVYPKGIVCNVTGQLLQGNYTFYNCIVTGVIVDCQQPTPITSTEPRLLEIWISQAAFEQFKQRAEELRKLPETEQWSASST